MKLRERFEVSEERPPKSSELIWLAILGSVVLAAHWRALTVFFAVDDFGAFASASIWPVPAPEELVAGRFLSQSAAFRIHQVLFGASAPLFHASVLLLHTLNAWLLYRCLTRFPLGVTGTTARTAALLFAVHPAAITGLAWVSAGFNEVPVVTCTLVALIWFLGFAASGGWWRLAASASFLTLALGFKQQAVSAWAYLLVLGLASSVDALASDRRARVTRTLFAAFLAAATSGWMVWAVLPRMLTSYGKAYEPLFEPRALITALGRLAAHALNPLPLLRAPLGAQVSVLLPTGTGGDFVEKAFIALVMLAVLGGAFVAFTRERVHWWLAWSVALFGSLLWAAPLSQHLLDYYTYLSLPAATVLTATGASALAAAARLNLFQKRLLVATLLAGATAGNQHLYTSNALVGQAERSAGLVGDLEARPGRPPARVCFVQPNDAAYIESGMGAALRMVRYGAPDAFSARAEFVGKTASAGSCRVASESSWLASFEEVAPGAWGVVWLAEDRMSDGQRYVPLPSGTVVRQLVRLSETAVSEVQIPLQWRGRGCVLEYSFRPQSEPNQDGGLISVPCGAGWNYRPFSIAVTATVSGTYELVLRNGTRDGEGTLLIPLLRSEDVATSPALWNPPGVETPATNSESLAFRTVVGSQ